MHTFSSCNDMVDPYAFNWSHKYKQMNGQNDEEYIRSYD